MPLFVSDKSLKLWLDEYAVSHQNSINKRIHVICVPVIFLTIVALIINISLILMTVLAVGVLWFYLRLSHSLFWRWRYLLHCVSDLFSWRIGTLGYGLVFLSWLGLDSLLDIR